MKNVDDLISSAKTVQLAMPRPVWSAKPFGNGCWG